MKIISVILIMAIVFVCIFGWGGVRFSGAPQKFDTRINYYPFLPVYGINLRPFDDNSPVRRYLKCVILPFERYTVIGGKITGAPIDGSVNVKSLFCDGFAYVAPERYFVVSP